MCSIVVLFGPWKEGPEGGIVRRSPGTDRALSQQGHPTAAPMSCFPSRLESVQGLAGCVPPAPCPAPLAASRCSGNTAHGPSAPARPPCPPRGCLQVLTAPPAPRGPHASGLGPGAFSFCPSPPSFPIRCCRVCQDSTLVPPSPREPGLVALVPGLGLCRPQSRDDSCPTRPRCPTRCLPTEERAEGRHGCDTCRPGDRRSSPHGVWCPKGQRPPWENEATT